MTHYYKIGVMRTDGLLFSNHYITQDNVIFSKLSQGKIEQLLS